MRLMTVAVGERTAQRGVKRVVIVSAHDVQPVVKVRLAVRSFRLERVVGYAKALGDGDRADVRNLDGQREFYRLIIPALAFELICVVDRACSDH